MKSESSVPEAVSSSPASSIWTAPSAPATVKFQEILVPSSAVEPAPPAGALTVTFLPAIFATPYVSSSSPFTETVSYTHLTLPTKRIV